MSQDFHDWTRFVLKELEGDATVGRLVIGVNGFYSFGQGFGGEERWTFATAQGALDCARGCILPRVSWPLMKSSFLWDQDWSKNVGNIGTRAGLAALTPRISRIRFMGTDKDAQPGSGSDFLSLPISERERYSSMYIPDHFLDYSPHRMITVPTH